MPYIIFSETKRGGNQENPSVFSFHSEQICQYNSLSTESASLREEETAIINKWLEEQIAIYQNNPEFAVLNVYLQDVIDKIKEDAASYREEHTMDIGAFKYDFVCVSVQEKLAQFYFVEDIDMYSFIDALLDEEVITLDGSYEAFTLGNGVVNHVEALNRVLSAERNTMVSYFKDVFKETNLLSLLRNRFYDLQQVAAL